MDISKATPRPWKAGEMEMSKKDWAQLHKGDFQIITHGSDVVAAVWCGDGEDEKATRDLIVQAVNSYEPLLEALKRLCLVQEGVPMTGIQAQQYLTEARAAISLAESKQS